MTPGMATQKQRRGSKLTTDTNSKVEACSGKTKAAQIQKPTVNGSELTNDSTNDSEDDLKVKTDS